jgi:hypothetical protein
MTTFLAVCGWLLIAASVRAHHSTAMYDTQNPVTITGKVTRFEWTNPHAFVYLEVTDEQSGKVVEWEVEMMSLNHLRSYGWTSRTVKPGDNDYGNGFTGTKRRALDDCEPDEAPDGREIRS